ncbi:MAG: alpha/beta fold hydrolase [Dongiaceae bacterium]
MHEIVIDGVRQRYHVAGSGPVCVIHSGGPGAGWEYLRMPLVEAAVTTVYVEPIGTGESGRLPDHPRGYTLDRYRQFLHGIIEHLGVPKVHLLGQSHGGFVAQHYALAHPDRLAGLILYSSAPAAGPELFAEATRNIEEFARDHEGRPEIPEILETWASIGSIADDEGYTQVMQRLLPLYFADYWGKADELAALRACLRAFHVVGGPAPFDNRDGLASIAVPTLVISGRHDFICGMRWAQELMDGIPAAKLLILEKSGHFGHIEEAERFAREVSAFVGSAA